MRRGWYWNWTKMKSVSRCGLSWVGSINGILWAWLMKLRISWNPLILSNHIKRTSQFSRANNNIKIELKPTFRWASMSSSRQNRIKHHAMKATGVGVKFHSFLISALNIDVSWMFRPFHPRNSITHWIAPALGIMVNCCCSVQSVILLIEISRLTISLYDIFPDNAQWLMMNL